MPPSQKGSSFRRKDIAKAFFDLDISDGETSIASKAPKPRARNPRVASRPPPPLNKVKRDNKVTTCTLLTLPVEIRLRIYDLLLVSRFDRSDNPSWAVGQTDQKNILLHMGQFRQYRTMEPRILQTCRQIHNEANPILYSRNVFAISNPEHLFRLFLQCGPANFALVKTLDIWVPWMADLASWLQLLDLLAANASGLRRVELAWGTNYPTQRQRGRRERGLGDNLDFVRALARIRGLDQLVISGHYAMHWPAYLERMGMPVRAIRGHRRGELEAGVKEGERTEEDLKCEQFDREWNEEAVQDFMEYQQGTEDLIPWATERSWMTN